jgi:hypothetical protein
MKFRAVVIGAVALLVSAGAVSAADITQIFTITAEDFTPYYGSTPIDPLEAAFKITYDPAVETYPTAVGITAISANFPTLTPKFTYLPQDGEEVVIATKPTVGGGAMTTQNGDYDFILDLAYHQFVLAQYIASDGSGEYLSQTGTYSVSAVPEPATWMLWITGAGLAGATLRRRKCRVIPSETDILRAVW